MKKKPETPTDAQPVSKSQIPVRSVRAFQALLQQFLPKNGEITLETRVGYYFRNPELLAQAMVHRSWIVGRELEYWQTNERLEFLGDSVLNMLVTDWLYKHYPELPEGDLSKMKGSVVSGKALAESARMIGLGPYIRVGRGEAKGGGREKESLLADAFESVIGAIFIDGGVEPCRKMLEKTLFPRITHILSDSDFTNYKSLLLESLQSKGFGMPTYTVLAEEGPEHLKEFKIEVYVQGELWGTGAGTSKKRAEQEAARAAMQKFPEMEQQLQEKLQSKPDQENSHEAPSLL